MIDRPLEFRTVRDRSATGGGASRAPLRLTADLRVRPENAPAAPTPATETLQLQAQATAAVTPGAAAAVTPAPASPTEASPAAVAPPSSTTQAETAPSATAPSATSSEPAPATETSAKAPPAPDHDTSPANGSDHKAEADPARMKAFRDGNAASLSGVTIEGQTGGPVMAGSARPGAGQGGGGNGGAKFHKRMGPEDFQQSLKLGIRTVWRNLSMVMVMTCATNVLILAIPIYLFQISDRVLTSRSTDTLIMLTLVIVGAVILQSMFDAVRRFMLMRTAVEVAARLGAPVLSAAAAASLNGSGREYQTLGDLQQLRAFLVSGTLISFLDVPFAPLFILVIFMIHPHLGMIVVVTALLLLVVALVNQRITAKPFAEANLAQAKANMHLDSMSRNSQIINAMAMIPEAVTIWGRDTAASLIAQVRAQDRNIISASVSRAVRMLTQVGMLGWGAYLAIDGQITGGMVIAASIVAGRALAPIEGSIEGWNAFILSRAAYGRVAALLRGSRLQFERLWLPRPEGRLNVERLLYVPGGTKQVILNGISFALEPGDSLAVIGNSGAGKTTLGKMLVGSILPTSGNVRLDLMDLRNWDPRQLGENIGYLPQDVQLFPGTIKDNIGRMRADATDEQIHHAAVLADVHEMIASLPQGYETMVAADGSPLSGGQKQRIALARAFFGNPRLVVLDEPNSNLDTAGDKALARAIDHARKEKITVVVITQKPSLLNVVDKIMLLANGGVALFGQRDKVMAQLNPAAARAPQVPAGGTAALGQPQQPGTPRHV